MVVAGDAGDPQWRAPAAFSVAELHTVDSLLANADFMARVASAVRTFEDPETPDYMALRMLSGGRTKSHPLARPFALLQVRKLTQTASRSAVCWDVNSRGAVSRLAV